MLFSSMIFIFVFLPLVIGLYYLCPKNLKNLLLLLVSIIFYAWGEPTYVFILLGTILINYFGAIIINSIESNVPKKFTTILVVLSNLSILFYFKYFNFFIDNLNKYLHSQCDFIHVIMPIGISFYTFQAISYLIDVYKKEVKVQTNFINLALYITLFPQLIAGPIVKYNDICSQLTNRKESFANFILGLKRFIIGLSKKIIIANTLAEIADTIFNQMQFEQGLIIAWLGIVAYTLQIYFDFSGYSDMAIGLSKIFGFNIKENFNTPYISKSITEFWRRWHISLSSWFKQYLYIPLGGNRNGLARTCLNLLIVFGITGLWHGAAWTFILWGLWNGIFIIIEKLTGYAKKEISKSKRIYAHTYTMLVVMIGWVLFRSENIHYAISYIQSLFDFTTIQIALIQLIEHLNNYQAFILIIAIILSSGKFKNFLENSYKNNFTKLLSNMYFILLFVWSFLCLSASTYNPFIYFRF